MLTSYVARRTFTASKYAKSSELRAELNCNPQHSEYMPSHRYIAFYEIAGNRSNKTFRTKTEALAYIA